MNKFTNQEHILSMKSLIFLMDNRDGIIKGQVFSNGSIQHDCMNKEEV